MPTFEPYLARRFRRIVILTGAGISAESGVATFRDKDGIWSYREVATAQVLQEGPKSNKICAAVRFIWGIPANDPKRNCKSFG